MNNDVGQDDRRFPARALGEIVIVEVGEKISIGLVTLVGPGDGRRRPRDDAEAK